MDVPLKWLLEGPAYVQFRTRVDLLEESTSNPEVQHARQAMLDQPDVISLVKSLENWPGQVLSSHKSANQSFHTLNFLTDLGLKAGDPGVQPVAEKILLRASAQGPFSLGMNISTAHGGSGTDILAWALCDAPNQVNALIQLGLRDDARVQKALDFLVDLGKDNGWPCAVSPELGNFRGPGKKDDPCPYATLVMLKMLALLPEYRDHPAVNSGLNAILSLWKDRQEKHPYIFYMGTDFCKLKAPLIWYDIIHVLDVLSHFPQAKNSAEYIEMVDIVRSKSDMDGLYTPESIYQSYKNWDFGQKKVPSHWLTFLVYRILKRTTS